MTTLKSKIILSRRKAREKIKLIPKYKNIPHQEIVHHIDCNPFNNNFDNLCIIPNGEHMSLHWKLNPDKMGHWQDKDYLKELEEALILYNFNL